jgi:hypothetical protein
MTDECNAHSYCFLKFLLVLNIEDRNVRNETLDNHS